MKLSILWERSSAIKTWTHGYAKGRRMFTIEQEPQMPILLLRHLPGPNGLQSPLKCASVDDAKLQADRELTEFFKHMSNADTP